MAKSIKNVRNFVKLEAMSGIILFIMAMLAMIIDNSPLSHNYHKLLETKITFSVGSFQISKYLLMWINEGLMTIFFLLIGLEVKRELIEGELKELKVAMLPAVAALGGMLLPAMIYILFNWGSPHAFYGWGIPVATDIAFALGVLALLGRRIVPSLRLFLLALAIFDDIGAIVIIAFFYTQSLSWIMLVGASVLTLLLFLMNYFNVTVKVAYFMVGLLLWFFVLKSGVHATLSGILLAWSIPIVDKKKPKHSPLNELEQQLHPWVSYLILPLFAFANAGVAFDLHSVGSYFSSVTFGIIFGLFVGKQSGVLIFTWLAVRFNIAKLPPRVSFADIYCIGLLAGIGFTMSLFIGGLAFLQFGIFNINEIRVGVILGSILSGVTGYCVFKLRHSHYRKGGGEKICVVDT